MARSVNKDNRSELLKEIRDEVLNLTTSPLCQERIKNKVFPVLGEGSHYADIMFIGEAPGRNEAKTGRPFCGTAGHILDELLLSIDTPRQEVYITNIVKDRPPFNRDPLPDEITAYGPFLNRQIDIIQPKIIVTLGRFSMRYIMEIFGLALQVLPISNMHGKIFDANAPYGKIKIIPLYHPAVAIYNPTVKDQLMRDFKVITTVATAKKS